MVCEASLSVNLLCAGHRGEVSMASGKKILENSRHSPKTRLRNLLDGGNPTKGVSRALDSLGPS